MMEAYTTVSSKLTHKWEGRGSFSESKMVVGNGYQIPTWFSWAHHDTIS